MGKSSLALLVFGFLLADASYSLSGKSGQAYQLYSKGAEAAAKKHWDEAMKSFADAIDLNPNYVASYFEFSRAAMLAGNRKAALEKLNLGLKVAKSKADKEKLANERDNISTLFFTNETFQLYQNGLNYMKLDRNSSALESLEKAKKIEGDNILVLIGYADALSQGERTKEAVDILEEALAINDKNLDARLKLADLLLVVNPNRAANIVKTSALTTNDERIVLIYARALSLVGKNQEAIDFLSPKVDKQQGWIRSHYWLAKFYSIDPKGAWNARKYLMIFIKRFDATLLPMASKESVVESVDDRILKGWRADAGQLLERVNKSLE